MTADSAPSHDVALISMPWAPVHEPSLGLAILKSCLTEAGISARVHHFAPELLRWVTSDTYSLVADAWGLNEFVFSGELDPVLGRDQQSAVINRVETYWRFADGRCGAGRYTPASMLDLFMTMRYDVAPKLLDVAAERVLESSPKVVGFTCLFDQTIASLALASVLKARDPGLVIVFGGYALEGPPGMAVAKSFPCVDLVVVGDGERAIVDIAQRVLEGRPLPHDLLASERSGEQRTIRAPQVDINRTPTPDYADWYRDTAQLEKEHLVSVRTEVLPVESSRGCWWGQRKHCVFCGIDDDALKYRYRDPESTTAMLDAMREQYGDVTFRFSDYIMPKAYYTDLLPQLAAREVPFRLHTEIKANHPPERVEQLAAAGFVAIQPGIESFSSTVLRAMDKGVRGIDNVSLLKEGYRQHLMIYYNLLYGLPDDVVDDYRQMCTLLPRLYHLMPPVSRTEVVVTRFAPLQADPQRFGITTEAVHHECYDVLFSGDFLARSGLKLDDYCYYFARTFSFTSELATVYNQLVRQVDHWKALHRSRFVELSLVPTETGAIVRDSRFAPVPEEFELSRAAAHLHSRADRRPVSLARTLASARSDGGFSASELDDAVAQLDERRLVWREGDLLLGLALPKAVVNAHQDTAWPKGWLSNYV
ncbi:RiPP maturation radical SAM C-methyltransferase [Umezawaea beigongshangensis]|uniref:RiPP maturation radical SAM C-methyltransferase n=1 Tax=Umezawaea beigongshangensis TaxID=2780383 RepID=UPI0018F272E6|nr:RiPP maturation radical SAM C-methyltransferase [Umezawaea beigongshangensis]